jgi:hypothetical protein
VLTPIAVPAALTTCATPTTYAAFDELITLATLATPAGGPAPGRR